MCEFNCKLVAWMDGELPDAEAAAIEQHLQACEACRHDVARYREVSGAFDVYCQVASRPVMARPIAPWVLACGAIAAAVALIVFLSRAPAHAVPAPESATVRAPETLVEKAAEVIPAPASRTHRRHLTAVRMAPAAIPANVQNAMWMQPSIQIAIPADAIFPPGMMPAGFDLKADVSVAADGSLEALRLRQ